MHAWARAHVCVVCTGPVAVNLRTVGLEIHCRLPTCWYFNFVFSMADAVWLTTAPLPMTVWWRPGLGKGPLRWELHSGALPPEYSLHKKAQSGAKLLSQSRNIPMGRRLHHRQHTKFYAGTWNVRSLVEESGDRRVCCACGASQYGTTVERKLDLLVAELKSYNISIAGIQETKWFGSDIWPIGEWTFLHSGWDSVG